MTEIVILAMIAAFLGLRLYAVLGRRAEHEEEPIPRRVEGQPGQSAPSRTVQPAKTAATQDDRAMAQPSADLRGRELPVGSAAAERGLRDIAMADRRFDPYAFVEGARGAYRMILEAFWRGDKDELRQLCDADVFDSFAAAIDARAAAGETLDNRLVRIEETQVAAAAVEDGVARITVRFRADIAAVTRNAAGEVVAGSLHDAVEAVDVWTFSRRVGAADPDWLLDETDAG